ncbi:MAG: CCA tRNA nucleotidyltransferase [Planctomycetota bacterium]|nr:CCA tRNA nucleotidyltransferase [Planctomycetota bacterium]
MTGPEKRISNPKPIPGVPVREAALKVLHELQGAGYEAFFAGGCVRDRLLGLEPVEYDVATNARPEQVQSLFKRVQKVGEAFGVMLVRLMGHTIEVATFRTEGIYSDGRHPDDVAFSDAQHDAQRRDFTINGIFENPANDNEIIDFVGGREDLQNRIIRAIGDPHARLREDRLRMLRAVRFASRYEFELEEETAQAIREGAGELEGVSRERIGQEVKKMLTHSNRVAAAWTVQYLGLDRIVLEEDHLDDAPQRMGRLPESVAYSTILASWLIDRHEEEPEYWPRIADRWTRALMLSNEEHLGLKNAVEIYRTLMNEWEQMGVAKQKRLASMTGYEAGLALVMATDQEQFLGIRRRVEFLKETGLDPDPLIDGNDLIESGLKPGPAFSRLLDAVYDSQLEGIVSSREMALEMAQMLQRTFDVNPGDSTD